MFEVAVSITQKLYKVQVASLFERMTDSISNQIEKNGITVATNQNGTRTTQKI